MEVVWDHMSNSTTTNNFTNATNTTIIPNVTNPFPAVVPRGLDRIDQKSLPPDGKYNSKWDGTGVTIFIMDTGVRLSHTEFRASDPTVPGKPDLSRPSRARCGLDFFGTNCNDEWNHGTHVAATAAGRTAGLARNASIVAIKTFDRFGKTSLANLLAGLDYILGEKKAGPKNTPMVTNMSLAGFFTLSLNCAVARLVRAGIVMVVSAGNGGRNAIWYSPASTRLAITVGASEDKSGQDSRATFSNFGLLVDIFAYVDTRMLQQ